MKRAIIIDDEAPSRKLLVNLMKKYHLPIEVVGLAENGEEGLALIRKLHPDIVFLDVEMPGKNGLEVMEELQDAAQAHPLKIIVITAYDYFEYARTSLRLGAKDYLLKPIDYRQFIEMMQRVVGYNYTDHAAFNELLDYVDNNYAQSLSLESCANHVHVSPGYVTRLCKKYLGTSFKTWLNEMRIRKAIELLSDTELTIKEIAERVGYNNLNYFYRQFHAITGTTPKNYGAK
ncbi:MAG: response regulator [Clostridiales Family XIII bacterium]|jgi:YesN/AraC family two-component response regulator|nr:response regulator [Clostridiales Family XIII bacterium]